jgi:hypothetical protein
MKVINSDYFLVKGRSDVLQQRFFLPPVGSLPILIGIESMKAEDVEYPLHRSLEIGARYDDRHGGRRTPDSIWFDPVISEESQQRCRYIRLLIVREDGDPAGIAKGILYVALAGTKFTEEVNGNRVYAFHGSSRQRFPAAGIADMNQQTHIHPIARYARTNVNESLSSIIAQVEKADALLINLDTSKLGLGHIWFDSSRKSLCRSAPLTAVGRTLDSSGTRFPLEARCTPNSIPPERLDNHSEFADNTIQQSNSPRKFPSIRILVPIW